MPAAAAKAQLKAIPVEEYAKLRSLIDGIGEEQAMTKREDDTSPRARDRHARPYPRTLRSVKWRS